MPTCRACGATFDSDDELREHTEEMHPGMMAEKQSRQGSEGSIGMRDMGGRHTAPVRGEGMKIQGLRGEEEESRRKAQENRAKGEEMRGRLDEGRAEARRRDIEDEEEGEGSEGKY